MLHRAKYIYNQLYIILEISHNVIKCQYISEINTLIKGKLHLGTGIVTSLYFPVIVSKAFVANERRRDEIQQDDIDKTLITLTVFSYFVTLCGIKIRNGSIQQVSEQTQI